MEIIKQDNILTFDAVDIVKYNEYVDSLNLDKVRTINVNNNALNISGIQLSKKYSYLNMNNGGNLEVIYNLDYTDTEIVLYCRLVNKNTSVELKCLQLGITFETFINDFIKMLNSGVNNCGAMDCIKGSILILGQKMVNESFDQENMLLANTVMDYKVCIFNNHNKELVAVANRCVIKNDKKIILMEVFERTPMQNDTIYDMKIYVPYNNSVIAINHITFENIAGRNEGISYAEMKYSINQTLVNTDTANEDTGTRVSTKDLILPEYHSGSSLDDMHEKLLTLNSTAIMNKYYKIHMKSNINVINLNQYMLK